MADNRRHTSQGNANTANFDRLTDGINNLISSINGLQSAIGSIGSNNNNNGGNNDGDGNKKPPKKPYDPRVNINGLQNRYKRLGAQEINDTATAMKKFASRMKSAGGATSKFGSVMNFSGNVLGKFGKTLGKMKGGIGFLVSMIVDAANAIAKVVSSADKAQQDIQNRRNTMMTQRNINLSTIEAEGYTDLINTEFQKQMADFRLISTQLQGEQAIANQRVLANASAQINGTIGDINAAAWERLAAETDIQAERQKLGLEVGTYDENGNLTQVGRVQAKEQRVSEFAGWEYSARMAQREFKQRQEIMNAEAENARLNHEAIRNAAENPWGNAINYAIHGGKTALGNRDGIGANAVYGDERWNEQYGKTGTKEEENRFEDVNASTKIASAAVAGAVNSITKSVLGFDGIIDASLTKAETTLGRDITNATNKLNATIAAQDNYLSVSTEYFSKQKEVLDAEIDLITDTNKTIIDTNVQLNKMFQKMAQTVEQWALNFQDISYRTGIGMGVTNRRDLDIYSSFLNGVTTQLAKMYGMTADQVMQLQSGYKAGGITKLLNADDFRKQGAFSQIYLGGDIGTASELANNTELFNMGVSDTVDLMSEMAKRVNRIGLDGRKYMKDMTNYLKQANKYTFKDGVRGVAEMAKWAQNVRFNMNSLPQIIEGIQSGGLENVITRAAKMQVLGGRYAMFADPLAMYYEAYNDPAALAKRFNNMVKGMGRFDSKTGAVTFGQVEQELMRAFAAASGQSIEDLRAQATYNVKKNKVTGVSENLNDDQRQSLVNRAYYENGQWKVNTITGGTMNVSDVNRENFGLVQGDTYEDTMEKGMSQIVSFTQLFKGAIEGNLSDLAKGVIDSGEFASNMYERLLKNQEDYQKKYSEYVNMVADNMNKATENYTNSLEQTLNRHTESWNEVKEAIENQTTATLSILNDIYKASPYSKAKKGTMEGNLPTYVRYMNDKENENLTQNSTNTAQPTNNKNTDNVVSTVGDNTAYNKNTVQPSEPTGKPTQVYTPAKTDNLSVSTVGNNGEITIKPMKIELSGSIRLDSNNGSTNVDVASVLSNDPMFIRALSQMLSEEVSKKINGGRSIPR